MIVPYPFAPPVHRIFLLGGLRHRALRLSFGQTNKGQFLLRIEDTDRERFVADGPFEYF